MVDIMKKLSLFFTTISFCLSFFLNACSDYTSSGDAGSDAGTDTDSDSDAEGCPDDMIEVPGMGACIDANEYTNAKFAVFLTESGNDCGEDECRRMGEESSHADETYPPAIIGFDFVLGDGSIYEMADGVGEFPVSWVTWYGARDTCLWEGKTMCPWDVYYAACSHGGEWHFPYGGTAGGVESHEGYCEDYVEDACSDAMDGDREVGTKLACEGGYDGMFDLAGNVAEWGGTQELDGFWWFMGNSHATDWDSCDGVHYFHGPGCLFPSSPVWWQVDEPPMDLPPSEDVPPAYPPRADLGFRCCLFPEE
jgi:hypothetical protein